MFSNVLRSLAKLVRSLAKVFAFSCKSSDKLVLFTLQLAVVHIAPYVHNGAVHSFILNLDSNKEIRQCLDQGMVLGHSKTLNVA